MNFGGKHRFHLSLSLSLPSPLIPLSPPGGFISAGQKETNGSHSHRYLDFQINPTVRTRGHVYAYVPTDRASERASSQSASQPAPFENRGGTYRSSPFSPRFSSSSSSSSSPLALPRLCLLPFRFSLLFRGAARSV